MSLQIMWLYLISSQIVPKSMRKISCLEEHIVDLMENNNGVITIPNRKRNNNNKKWLNRRICKLKCLLRLEFEIYMQNLIWLGNQIFGLDFQREKKIDTYVPKNTIQY